ncbi:MULTISPECIES: methyl-accepting chemotaxis protein [unclassified Modicisalibacter]|uniref:methyl-accepting chemotaxis protein n=1 Tax=unclassified Modicisalibacter TaxID=2679913 RepID=UPI001E12C987|nr:MULTISPECIES: methyl-accepting chemotaxis protein [unclassified Modicisalibacter]MBZ9556949.1 PAS domain-containing protein [Modicisalibacter sp. R2A 31.J]MBZ9574338.1 PAS domain-containing protein [Modicisalibacter sp. MOD 31.J]
MRDNQPVTQREYPLDDEHYLISRTDLKGRITYANPAFVEVSGFSREELIGAPHSIVRHPDMPEAAFANLWETLEAGEPWRGLVKNRCKNGDHYWVDASVTPIYEEGELQGYASVRVKADPEACRQAEQVYAQLRAGKARGVRLAQGRIVRRGLWARLRRLRLRTLQGRMASMIGLALVLLVAGSGLGIYGLQASSERLHDVNSNGLKDVARLQQIDQLMGRGRDLVADPVSNPMSGDLDKVTQQVKTIDTDLDRLWGEFMDRGVNHSEAAQSFGDGLATYRKALDQVIESLNNGDFYQAYTAYNETLLTEGEKLSGVLNQLVSNKQAQAEALVEQAEAEKQRILMAQLGLIALGLVLLVIMGVASMRAIRRPIKESKQFTLQISAGNLGATMPSRRNDEIGELMAALDVMRKSLGSIVKDVDHSVSMVRPASRDIASGNEDLSSRTEQQASSLAETASSMEQMTATVKQNAANAREASSLAGNAVGSVRESGEVMGQVVDTMGRITDSSRKVSEIIGVIDSIAFQTNILALNASVEAARAGEQGRGFAVVAGEVRNLASRSAEAAKEIRALIDGSAQEIDGGAELVKRAEASIESVVGAVTKVNDIMGEIASASDEQTSGIEQVNQAVAQMDEVTQQNAERVQTSARAAQQLDEQVAYLANAIAVLRLSGSGKENVDRQTRFRAAAARRQSDSETPALDRPRTERQDPAAETASESEWETF